MNLMAVSEVFKNPFALIAAMVFLPMILISSLPRRWQLWASLVWFLLPLFGFFGVVIWEALTRPSQGDATLPLAFYGLAIVSPVVLAVWGGPTVVGILLGLALGRFRQPAKRSKSPAYLVQSPAPMQPSMDSAQSWPMIHVGPMSDRLVIGGLEIRCFKWWCCGPEGLKFINPKSAYPLICDVYEVGTAYGRTRFAAGEVSNGIWAFFSDAPHSLIKDGSDLTPVGGGPQPGPAAFYPPPGGPPVQKVSPDGTIRVDIESREWGNTQWVNAPRVTDIGKDKVVLDLWRTDCDTVTTFPQERCVELSVRRYIGGQAFRLRLDVGRRTYELAPGPGLDLPAHSGSFDDLAGLVERLVSWPAARSGRGTVPGRPVRAVWQNALLIVTGAALAIGAVGYYSYITDVSQVIITPMPQPPGVP